MKRRSVLDHQSVKRKKQIDYGQWGFGLVRIFLVLLCLGGLSLAFVSGYQVLSSSRFFRLKKIVIAGVDDKLKQEVIRASGLTRKESLLSIDVAGIKSKIEAHPLVKSVFLKREFPHTLCIKAENEEPVAIAVLDKMYFVNTEAEIFKEVESNDSVDFPVITGLSVGSEHNRENLKRVIAFLDLVATGETLLCIDELSEVYVSQDGSMSIYTTRFPFKVSLGREEFRRKLYSLEQIIQDLRSAHRFDRVRSIDLDYSDRAIVALDDSVT